ncbi:hypothetical protein ACLK17_16375 [Escherichia coli]
MSFAAGALPRGISAGARDLLQHYRFPGNVRELEHAIHRAVVLARATRSGDEVILEAQHFAFPEVTSPPPEAAAVPVVKQTLREATEAFQRETFARHWHKIITTGLPARGCWKPTSPTCIGWRNVWD